MTKRWRKILSSLMGIFDRIKDPPYSNPYTAGPKDPYVEVYRPPDRKKTGGVALDEEKAEAGETGKAEQQPDEPTKPAESEKLWVINPERFEEALRKANQQPDEPAD
jgi:hypothetical protein